jgi:hypothetical protein
MKKNNPNFLKRLKFLFFLSFTCILFNCSSNNDTTLPGELDTDNDGVIDFNDDCISTPGTAEYNGCPAPEVVDEDLDNDGIIDDDDECPNVAGTQALNGCPVDNTGNIMFNEIGNGVNLQPSYYNEGNPTIGYDLMDDYPEIQSIRIEIEPFISVNQAKQWLQGAQDIGLTVIATYHDNNGAGLGNDIKQNLIDAANWWADNYLELRESGPFIVNMSNEWGSHNITAAAYADAYNDAIEIVRGVYGGLIIIDVPGYGQNVKVAADASTLITDQNIILSAHIYEGAYYQPENRALEFNDLDQLEATGRPCIIGEFGHDATVDLNETEYADWRAIVEYARDDLNWPILAWVWNGDGGSSMNMVSPSWVENGTATTFTPDPEHMDRVINIIKNTTPE